jgi:hypothetical protein
MRAALLLALLPGPALAADRNYSVTDFDRIRIDGPYAVTLRTGPASSAAATGDMRAIDRLSVTVQGRTLIVRTDSSAWGGWKGESPGRVALSVTTPALTSAILGGAGALAIDRAKAMRFELGLSGSGSIAIAALAADRLALTLVGNGKVTVAGSVAQTRATLQGGGTIEAGKLASDDLELGVSGTGDARFAAKRSAKVTAAGSGTVTVTGNAACTVNSAGSGEVRCGKEAGPPP